MTKRHTDEVILGRWSVGPEALRLFTAKVRARFGKSIYSPRPMLEACDAAARDGLEVVCRDDAVFVGTWVLAFDYNGVSGVRLEDDWLLFEMEGGEYDIPVPVGANGRAEAARMADEYMRMGAEEVRRYREARAAPTLNNRLLDIAEKHFVWVILGFFFLLIPAVVFLAVLLRGSSR